MRLRVATGFYNHWNLTRANHIYAACKKTNKQKTKQNKTKNKNKHKNKNKKVSCCYWTILFPHYTKNTGMMNLKSIISTATCFTLWPCGLSRVGDSPTRMAKMRKKISEVWGKIRKNWSKFEEKLRKVETLAHPGLWG